MRPWLRLGPQLTLLAGMALMVFGFAIDPLWPAQDMPPALAERYRQDAACAAAIYRGGAVPLAFGGAWLCGRWLWRGWRRRQP
ncbi:MAG TPA: hypothetical protein VGM87_15340 [Roseomonas sp.]|jgi:hypothetical protein